MLFLLAGTVEEEITKTYSVHAVVDQKEKTKLPFHDAVERGLIDPDTGGYVNNVTGEKLTAEEAIERGTDSKQKTLTVIALPFALSL